MKSSLTRSFSMSLFSFAQSRARTLNFLSRALLTAGWLAAAGCSTPRLSIISEPPDALIQANGVNLGKAPMVYPLDFSKTPSVIVAGSKTGYFTEQVILTKKTLPADNQL